MRNRPQSWMATVAVLVMLSACTTGAEQPVSTSVSIVTTTTTPVDGVGATADFRQCMSDNGVEVTELPFDADGRPRLESLSGQLDYSDPATTEALSTCASFLSDGALDLGYDEDYRESVVAQLAAFSRCLRARGVEGFPDPIAGFIGIGSPFPGAEIPYNDPDLPDAVAACEVTVFGESGIIDG
jgi:hypothetical protein